MIRKANIKDSKNIQALVNAYAKNGEMLPLSLNDIYENILKFVVWEEDGELLGCVAMHPTWEDMAEVRSIAVAAKAKGRGIGYKLVEVCMDMAREIGMEKIFLLTYVPDFFRKLGFELTDKENLPKKIWADCLKCTKFPDCDEIAMIKEL